MPDPRVQHFMPKPQWRKVVRVERGVEKTMRSAHSATLRTVFRLFLECGHSVYRHQERSKILCKGCKR